MISPHPSLNGEDFILRAPHADMDVGKGDTFSPLVKVKTGATPMKLSVEVPWNLELDLPQGPAPPLLCIFPKDSTSHCRDTCASMFTAALFTTAQKRNQLVNR